MSQGHSDGIITIRLKRSAVMVIFISLQFRVVKKARCIAKERYIQAFHITVCIQDGGIKQL